MPSIVCGCGTPVETKPEWAGQWITCSGCGGALYAPYPGDKPAPAPVVPEIKIIHEPTRLCPTCAETISQSDPVCRFCGAGDKAPAAPPRPASRPGSVPARPADTGDGGMGALILGLVGYMFCGLLCPIAWMLGASYERDCRARGVEPSGAGRAGKIIGIIGTVFLALNVLGLGLWVLASCL